MRRAATYGALIFLCAAFGAAAQDNPDLGAQQGAPSAAPSSNSMAHQGGGADSTLEISPQTGIRPPTGSSNEIPGNREFNPGDNTASVNPNFRPGEQETNSNLERGGHRGNANSCLGIHVNYTNYCFKGAEEHGLEITEIDRNSPAEKAGLKAASGKSGMIAAAETASAVVPFLQMFTNHLLEKEAMSERGDLIVAIDDQRVRSQADFDDAMKKLRPGDTMYLTVIRPLPGGDHATKRIAVKVGNWQDASRAACIESTAPAKPNSGQ